MVKNACFTILLCNSDYLTLITTIRNPGEMTIHLVCGIRVHASRKNILLHQCSVLSEVNTVNMAAMIMHARSIPLDGPDHWLTLPCFQGAADE